MPAGVSPLRRIAILDPSIALNRMGPAVFGRLVANSQNGSIGLLIAPTLLELLKKGSSDRSSEHELKQLGEHFKYDHEQTGRVIRAWSKLCGIPDLANQLEPSRTTIGDPSSTYSRVLAELTSGGREIRTLEKVFLEQIALTIDHWADDCRAICLGSSLPWYVRAFEKLGIPCAGAGDPVPFETGWQIISEKVSWLRDNAMHGFLSHGAIYLVGVLCPPVHAALEISAVIHHAHAYYANGGRH